MASEEFIDFLKNYGLYRKFKPKSVPHLNAIVFPSAKDPLVASSITRFCETCKKDERKFKCLGVPSHQPLFTEMPNALMNIEYKCVECESQVIKYVVYVNHNDGYMMKVGQWPSWLPKIDRNLGKALGDDLEVYKKGLYCENEGCGIGAFAYYRRVVEDIINDSLDQLFEALEADDTLEAGKKSLYETAYKTAKKTKDTENKIEIAIEMVPEELVRDIGTNPLKMLHSCLSIGIHSEPDEKCLNSAADMRIALNYLVKGIADSKNRIHERKEKDHYSAALRKLEKSFIKQS